MNRWAWGGPAAALMLACVANAAVVFRIDASKAAGPCDPALWANIGYDPMWSSTLDDSRIAFWQYVRQHGAVKRVRCHNTFTSGLPLHVNTQFPLWYFGCDVYRVGPDGRVRYVWQQLDEVLDVWVSAGIDPIIELDFMPDALAEGRIRRNYGGGAVNAPRDYEAWRKLIEATVRHMVERYGLETVRRWRFELWNEPDLRQYFIDGGLIPRGVSDVDDPRVQKAVARLCRMYDHAAAAIKAVDRELKVGGPGIAGFSIYLAAFLQHCLAGRNDVTGRTGAPLDFISWHCYGYLSAQLGKIAEMRRVIAQASPRLLELELQENEWGQPLGRREPRIEASTMRPFEAANLCKMIRAMWDSPDRSVDMFLRWGQPVGGTTSMGWRRLSVLTDNGQWAPLPVLQAYALLARLGPERATVKPSTTGPLGVLAARRRDGVQVVVYYADERDVSGEGRAQEVVLRLTGLPLADGSVPVEHYRLDAQHGDVAGALLALKEPRGNISPQRIQEAVARAADIRMAEPGRVQVKGGACEISLTMPSASVSFLFIGQPPPTPAVKPSSPLVRRVLAGEDEYASALAVAGEGRESEAAAKMEGVASRYEDLIWGRKAWWWLAEYHARSRRPRQALDYANKLLACPLRAFDRAQLLQWAADRAAEAGDEVARTGYLQSLERELNLHGATTRWAVAKTPPPRPGQPVPPTIPTGLRAGEAVRVASWQLRLEPAQRVVAGYGVAGSAPGRALFGVVRVRCPSARKAALEVVPWTTVAVWCNGERAYALNRRQARWRTYLYADLRLNAGINEIAVLNVRGAIRVRLVDANGQPMPDVQFPGT